METGVDTGSVLVLLSQQQRHGGRERVFECKTCGRRFPTFQALGGHRASHRRPRPYGAPGLRRTTVEAHEEGECAGGGRTVHGCPVCGLEFAVGQALGGHMRRHRSYRTTAADAEAIRAGDGTLVKDADAGAGCAGGICLDLNLATSVKCAECCKRALCSAVQGAQKTMLLDCPL